MILYKEGSTLQYSTSIAATWTWAPTLYTTSFMGYNYGYAGVFCTTFFNALTLIIFGFVVQYLATHDKVQRYTFLDALQSLSVQQRILHLVASLMLLICCTWVQYIGLHLWLLQYFEIPKIVTALIVSGISLAIVFRYGIKASIISDKWKYFIIVSCGLSIAVNTLIDPSTDVSKIKILDTNDLDYLTGFFITVMVSHLTALYADQNYWQRAFSLAKENIFKVFSISALLFVIIPFCFGSIGVLARTQGFVEGWEITQGTVGIFSFLFGLALFSAIISTVDSNLCAIQSLGYVGIDKYKIEGNTTIYGLLIFVSTLFCITDISITDLFLIYGTIRAIPFIPTLLGVFTKRFSEQRLFYATLAAIVFFSFGYVVAYSVGYSNLFIFTLIAVFTPILGVSWKKQLSTH